MQGSDLLKFYNRPALAFKTYFAGDKVDAFLHKLFVSFVDESDIWFAKSYGERDSLLKTLRIINGIEPSNTSLICCLMQERASQIGITNEVETGICYVKIFFLIVGNAVFIYRQIEEIQIRTPAKGRQKNVHFNFTLTGCKLETAVFCNSFYQIAAKGYIELFCKFSGDIVVDLRITEPPNLARLPIMVVFMPSRDNA